MNNCACCTSDSLVAMPWASCLWTPLHYLPATRMLPPLLLQLLLPPVLPQQRVGRLAQHQQH